MDRIVWANVLAESNGLALLLVAKSHTDGAHSMVFAEENAIDRVFEGSRSLIFELGSTDVMEIGKTLKVLGSKLIKDESVRALKRSSVIYETGSISPSRFRRTGDGLRSVCHRRTALLFVPSSGGRGRIRWSSLTMTIWTAFTKTPK